VLAVLLSLAAATAVLLTGLAELDLHETFPEAMRIPLLGTLCARKFSLRYFLLKALDAVVTADRTPVQRWADDARALVHPRGAHYDRVGAAARLAARLWPGAGAVASRVLLRPDKLPFAVSDIELAGYGFSATVFRMTTPAGEYALKVYRDSLGHNLRDALAYVAEFQRHHEVVTAAYNWQRKMVLPVRFCVLQAPLLGSLAAAGVQPFLCGTKRDLFHDLSDEEILALAWRHEGFRQDFKAFVWGTLTLARTGDYCLDILGRENVVVAETAEPRLVIMDTGGFQLSQLELFFPERLARLNTYLERLERLARQLEDGQPAEPGKTVLDFDDVAPFEQTA
jgi:hypothetical protein